MGQDRTGSFVEKRICGWVSICGHLAWDTYIPEEKKSVQEHEDETSRDVFMAQFFTQLSMG